MNILKDEDVPEGAEAGSLQQETQQLSKLLSLVFCRIVQCGGGWEKDWWWFFCSGEEGLMLVMNLSLPETPAD